MRVFALSLCLWAVSSSAVTPVAPTPGMLPGDWQVQLQRLTRLMLEQEQLLQQLQTEVREVRGENEVLQHRVEEFTQRQRDFFSDLDQRLARLESGSASVPANAEGEPASTDTEAKLLPDTENPAPEAGVQTSTETDDSTEISEQEPTTNPNDGTADSTPPVAGDSEHTLYQNAFDLLQAGQFDRAIQGFQALLQTYPRGEYAGNAQYWLGESFYAKQDYSAALRNFNAVLENYPDSNKRAQALLKIGYAYNAINNNAKARQVLEYVRDKFPGTATARLAEERLQRLR